jgi:copper chaperone
MATIALQVSGMKCGGCENQIQEAIKACIGVHAVKATHKTGTVDVEYDETKTDLDSIRKTIRDKGFTVE